MGCGSSTGSPNKVAQLNERDDKDKETTRRVVVAPADPPSGQGLVFREAVDNSSNLFAAIKRGDVEIAKGLITSSGPGVNHLIGMWGSTPLIVAAQYGQKEIILLLLNQQDLGDLNHINEKGATLLLYACMEGMVDTVRRTFLQTTNNLH